MSSSNDRTVTFFCAKRLRINSAGYLMIRAFNEALVHVALTETTHPRCTYLESIVPIIGVSFSHESCK